MKNKFFLLFVLFLSAVFICRAQADWSQFRRQWTERKKIQNSQMPTESGDYEYSVTSQGVKRPYWVHVPPSYQSNTPTAVVFNFHGGGGSMKGHVKTSRMNEASDRDGYLVVYPSGTRPDGDTSPFRPFQRYWNVPPGPTGPFNTNSIITHTDDAAYARTILEDLKSKFNVDPKRIYATGFSNGAIFVQYLGTEMSDVLAAIAPISGPYWEDMNTAHLKGSMSVMYFQGTEDPCAPYQGGASQCEQGHAGQNRVFPAAEDTVKLWREKLECPAEPRVTYQKGSVTCYTYGPGKDGDEITFCKMEGAGHQWPGGKPYSIPGIPSGKPTQDIDANLAMWEFFQKHPKI